jgi:copper(I)-binding protein
VFVGTGTTHITLTGLQSTLSTGQYVTLILRFQKAGDVTVKATVANPTAPLSHSNAYNFDQSNVG